MSARAISIYKLLLEEGKPLTAKEISSKFKVWPHGLYRILKSLQDYGLITVILNRPSKFSAISLVISVESYLIHIRHLFLNTFRKQLISTNRNLLNNPDISFIQGRMQSISNSTQDIRLTKLEILMIVSGNEIPAETILMCKRAIERGVRIRILVQKYDKKTLEMLKNWERIGIKIRLTGYTGARIFIYDSQIAYISSYNKLKKEESFGVRFKYQPIALILKQIFEERWQIGERLKKFDLQKASFIRKTVS